MTEETKTNWEKEDKLSLDDIKVFLEELGSEHNLNKLPNKWGGLFQSPVNKYVTTLHDGEEGPLVRFDPNGALDINKNKTGDKVSSVYSTLSSWLKLENNRPPQDNFKAWLKDGAYLKDHLLYIIINKLEEESIKADEINNRPICRLVRADQLRYDPTYQVLYQLTPADLRLIQEDEEKSDTQYLKKARNNLQIIWSLSEIFQGAIGMFDSDLGKTDEKEERKETKEFLRFKYTQSKWKNPPVTPHELNMFSSHRYWSPPTSFARNVFHMLFWKPIITGKDLFHRPFPEERNKDINILELNENDRKQLLKKRAEFYYVAINFYQNATFQITSYTQTLRLLNEIAKLIWVKSEESWNENDGVNNVTFLDAPATEIEDIIISLSDSDLFLSKHFREDQFAKSNKPINLDTEVILPLKSIKEKNNENDLVWNLVSQYNNDSKGNTTSTTKVGHLLWLIRDMMIQIILWSKFQMEIRSIGHLPIRCLYKVELDDDHIEELSGLMRKFAEAENNETNKEENLKKINTDLIKALQKNENGNIEIQKWVKLKRVYNRSQEILLSEDENRSIKRLEPSKKR